MGRLPLLFNGSSSSSGGRAKHQHTTASSTGRLLRYLKLFFGAAFLLQAVVVLYSVQKHASLSDLLSGGNGGGDGGGDSSPIGGGNKESPNRVNTPEQEMAKRMNTLDTLNAAVVYLSPVSGGGGGDLRSSLLALHDHFFAVWRKYPVYILHEPDVTDQEIQDFKSYLPTDRIDLEFVPVQDWASLPEGLDLSKSNIAGRGRFPEYNYMIRLFFKNIFFHPKIGQLDYYMRLDTDSSFSSPLPYDPFKLMRKNDMYYGFAIDDYDPPAVTVSLLPNIAKFVDTHRTYAIDNQVDYKGTHSRIYYNNLEVVDIQRFRQSDVVEFTDFIDRTYGIFDHRWGDAPLRWWTVNLLFEASHVLQLCGFGYIHQQDLNIKKCTEDDLKLAEGLQKKVTT